MASIMQNPLAAMRQAEAENVLATMNKHEKMMQVFVAKINRLEDIVGSMLQARTVGVSR